MVYLLLNLPVTSICENYLSSVELSTANNSSVELRIEYIVYIHLYLLQADFLQHALALPVLKGGTYSCNTS